MRDSQSLPRVPPRLLLLQALSAIALEEAGRAQRVLCDARGEAALALQCSRINRQNLAGSIVLTRTGNNSVRQLFSIRVGPEVQLASAL